MNVNSLAPERPVSGRLAQDVGALQQRYLPTATVATLLVMLVVGGSAQQGRLSDAVVELASLPLLMLVLTGLVARPVGRSLAVLVAISALILAAPLLQLIPLPPSVWTTLPGRDVILRAYEAATLALPWQPLSLSPWTTWQSFYALLPPVALLLATVGLPRQDFYRLLGVAVLFGVFSTFLGLAQLSYPTLWLRPYGFAYFDEAVGLFPWRNGYSALLYSLIPFSLAAVFIALWRQGERLRLAHVGLALTATLLLALGVLMARSRAGFLLGFLSIGAMLCIGLITGPQRPPRIRLVGVFAIALLAVLGLLQIAFSRVASRLTTSLADDLRWPMAETTLEAIRHLFPFGSGFGSFVRTFQIYETDSTLLPQIINHAHNDYLELLMEGGALTLIVAVPVLLLLVVTIYRVVFRYPAPVDLADRLLARASILVVLGLMVHSTLDYPLRAHANMAVLVLALAALMRPALGLAPPEEPWLTASGEATPRKRRRHKSRSAPSLLSRLLSPAPTRRSSRRRSSSKGSSGSSGGSGTGSSERRRRRRSSEHEEPAPRSPDQDETPPTSS